MPKYRVTEYKFASTMMPIPPPPEERTVEASSVWPTVEGELIFREKDGEVKAVFARGMWRSCVKEENANV